MKFKNIIPAAVALLSLGFASCVGDLDVENINPQQVPDLNSDALLNKIYANLVVTGQSGPAGNGDIDDIDEGTSNLVRQLWNANELTTDEAHCVWGDPGISTTVSISVSLWPTNILLRCLTIHRSVPRLVSCAPCTTLI